MVREREKGNERMEETGNECKIEGKGWALRERETYGERGEDKDRETQMNADMESQERVKKRE